MKAACATALVALACLAAGCADAVLVKPVKLPPETKMIVLESPDGPTFNKVALIKIEGAVFLDDRSRGTVKLQSVKQQLDMTAADSNVKAAVLSINSPGGSVAAVDLLYNEIRRFKESSGIPVIAQISGVGASGGYYAALAADEISASPASITGSIGVILQLFNLEGLLDKIGVGTETIKTGDKKDMGSPLVKLRDEDRAIFQEMLDSFHDRFVSLVAERRKGLSKEEAGRLADGRIYTAQQALDNGLIDALRYPNQTFERAKELAGASKAKLVGFQTSMMSAGFGFPGADVSLFGIDASSVGSVTMPGFYYLWLPSAR